MTNKQTNRQTYRLLLYRLLSPLSPFHWPQNMWPWVTLTGYLASNSVFAPVWLADIVRLRKIIAWKLTNVDTYCHRCRSLAGTLVFGNIRFVWIFCWVLQKGDIKRQWGRASCERAEVACWSLFAVCETNLPDVGFGGDRRKSRSLRRK